jgi:histidinol-phosphate aminotransferase
VGYLRKNIESMAGYTPGEQPAPGDRVIKLNTNENPYPPSPRVIEAVRGLDPDRLRRYPDPMANRVRDLVARMFGVARENVLCGNGSDELLTLVTRAFVSEGERMAYPVPTYSLYPVLARIQGAEAVEIPTNDDFSLPLETLAKVDARILILCNPNAPTGVFTPPEAVDKLAADFNGVVVVDEAYVDFAPTDCMRLASERPNVLVLRTLSKSYSLAGLRFGYAVGPAPLIAGLEKVKDSYNVDAVSIELALAALADQAWMQSNVAKIRSERARLAAALAKLGFEVTPSEANFILVRAPGFARAEPRYAGAKPGGKAEDLYKALKARGILVRYWNLPRLDDKLRITVGAPAENDALLSALRAIVSV